MSDKQKPTPGFLGAGTAAMAGRMIKDRNLRTREEDEAQTQGAAPQSGGIPAAGGEGFFKSPSDDEKLERQRKLSEILRRRGSR